MAYSIGIRPIMLSAALLSILIAASVVSTADAFSASPSRTFSTQTTSKQHEHATTRNPTLLSATATLSAPVLLTTPPPTFALFGLVAKKGQQQQNQNSKFSIPSLFHPSDSRPIVLFDGKCNLCNAGVQLILDSDRASSDPRGNLRVAALQSRVGKILLARFSDDERAKVLKITGSDEKEYKSIVVVSESQTWLNSAACLRIGRELKGPLRYLALLASLIPAFVRDPIYKLMSRYRKKLFGESEGCRLWDDNWDTRFVDDGLFGGKGANDVDPFADPSLAQESSAEEEDDDVNVEEAPVGAPQLVVGDRVRVISSKPILHTHVEGYEENGLCSVGLVGTVSRVLERQSYPKNVAVKFELEKDGNSDDGGITFESHFFPGQLQKE